MFKILAPPPIPGPAGKSYMRFLPSSYTHPPTGPGTPKPKKGKAINAETMAKRQREISVSEFFTKNRHLLGFDSPRKALLTARRADSAAFAADLRRFVRALLGRAAPPSERVDLALRLLERGCNRRIAARARAGRPRRAFHRRRLRPGGLHAHPQRDHRQRRSSSSHCAAFLSQRQQPLSARLLSS